MTANKVRGLHMWLTQKGENDMGLDLSTFTEEVVLDEVKIMCEKADRDAVLDSSQDLVPCPRPFRNNMDWRTWRDGLSNYLSLKTGSSSQLPLAYVTRPIDAPLEGAELASLATEHHRQVRGTAHGRPIMAPFLVCSSS